MGSSLLGGVLWSDRLPVCLPACKGKDPLRQSVVLSRLLSRRRRLLLLSRRQPKVVVAKDRRGRPRGGTAQGRKTARAVNKQAKHKAHRQVVTRRGRIGGGGHRGRTVDSSAEK